MVWCDGDILNYIAQAFSGRGVQFEASGNYVWIIDIQTYPVIHKLRISDGQEIESWTVANKNAHNGICLEPEENYWRIAYYTLYIHRYDYSTHAKISTINTGLSRIQGIAWYDNRIYAVSENTIRKIDPDNGDIITTFTLQSTTSNYRGITRAGDYWYVSVNDGAGFGREIHKFDDDFNLLNECTITTPYSGNFNIFGLGYDGSYIWLEDSTHSELYRCSEIEPSVKGKKKRNWYRVGLNMRRF